MKRELIIESINYAAYCETDSSLHDADKNRLLAPNITNRGCLDRSSRNSASVSLFSTITREHNATGVMVFTRIVMCILGVLFMFAAFFGTGIGPAFSRTGPLRPISKTGRVLLFLTGTVVFVDGLEQLLGRSGWPHVGWRLFVPFAAVALLALLLNSKLVGAQMERMGRSSRPIIAINFANGLPPAMVGAHIAFFVIAAMIVVFGVAPLSDSTARAGIIACVLALFGVAFVYGALEQYYLKSGRATEVTVHPESTHDRNREA